MISNSMSTLRQFLANPTDLLRSQVADYSNELEVVGLRILAAITRLIASKNRFIKAIISPVSSMTLMKRSRTQNKIESCNAKSVASLLTYATEIDSRAAIRYRQIIGNVPTYE